MPIRPDPSSDGATTANLDDIEQPARPNAPAMGWVSDAVAEMLRRLGIDYVALVPGSSYRGLHDSLVNYLGNSRPQMLVCLHEEHAVAIAHGYSKVTEKPMAAAVHANVGLMHATMAIYDAWCDRAPVIVLGATGPVDAAKRRPWIDWIHTAQDQGALIRSYVKWDDQPGSAAAAVESPDPRGQDRGRGAARAGLCLPRRRASRNWRSTRRRPSPIRRAAARRRRPPRQPRRSPRPPCCSRAPRSRSSWPAASAAAPRRGRSASRSPRRWAPRS